MEEESTYYQYIVARGHLQEARRLLMLVGEDVLGEAPTSKEQAIIEAFSNPEQLENLIVRAGHVNSWAELLCTSKRCAALARRSNKS
jgi:hypothetical protein